MEEELTAIQKIINTAIEFCVNYSFQVVGALIILIAGGMIAGWVANLVLKVFEKKQFDITLAKFPEIVTDPKPIIGVQEFADSSINIGYRYWVPTVEFFKVSYAVNLAIYKALLAANIKIPYPQRDLHIVSQLSTEVPT